VEGIISNRGDARWAWLIIISAIWLPVIYLISAQWTYFEQYNYGWIVPALCIFLAWERIQTLPPSSIPQHRIFAISLIIFFGLSFWSSRILQEANPIWRVASYGLAVSAGAITLLLIYFVGGKNWARHFAFPVAFFLVAVPWPTPLENFVIQSLTRLNTTVVVEILNTFSIPALAHGNVIEISTGNVGIDEACSGIRSLQATLMISLFFGEFYKLRIARRFALIFSGFFFAMLFNICRTYFLTWIASRQGIAAINKWHDTAGIFLLVVCFIAIWILALFFQKIQKPHSKDFSEFHETETQTKNFHSFNVIVQFYSTNEMNIYIDL